MADPLNSAPSSSYSDPIYDRLDSVAQRIAKRWVLVVLAILAAVAIAVVLRLTIENRPEAKSAQAFVQAQMAEDDKREAEFMKVAEDQSLTAFFRARAYCELAQIAIEKGRTSEAKKHAESALKLSKETDDLGLQLDAKLSVAAADEEMTDNETALSAYQQVASSAGGRFPNQLLIATLSAARVQAKMGKEQDAIETLEGIINKTDAGARSLIDCARLTYWQLKNKVGGKTAESTKAETPESDPAVVPPPATVTTPPATVEAPPPATVAAPPATVEAPPAKKGK